MPSFETALGRRDVSSGHVDALARASGRLDEATREADLLADASRQHQHQHGLTASGRA